MNQQLFQEWERQHRIAVARMNHGIAIGLEHGEAWAIWMSMPVDVAFEEWEAFIPDLIECGFIERVEET